MPGASTKKKAKQPATFEPTPEQRKRVQTLAGYGMGQREIAAVIKNPHTGKPVSVATLRKRFEEELRTGKILANSQMAESLYNMGVGRAKVVELDGEGRQIRTRVEAVKPDHSAAMFWMKCHGGWIEEDKRQALRLRADRVKLEQARVRIAERLMELKGVVDDDTDPREYARQIKQAIDEIMSVTRVPDDPD